MGRGRYSDDHGPAPRPAKKQRKQRPSYSCQECRRLKMKCDRRVPCSNCVRRHRADMCHGASTSEDTFRSSPASADQGENGQQQQQQQKNPKRSPRPDWVTNEAQHASTTVPVLDYQSLQPQQQHLDALQPQLHFVQPLMPSTQPSQYDHHANQYDHDNQVRTDKLEQLALLARAIEPLATSQRGTNSQSPGRLPPPVQAPGQSSNAPAVPSGHTGGGGGTNVIHASQHIDHPGDQNGSYGTLMFSKGGRSKYLGPTAGSEWLKDSETREMSVTPTATRAPSPEATSPSISTRHHRHPHSSSTAPITFPLHASQARISTRDLLSRLPSREEAWILVESYYRYCAWHHDVAPKNGFEKTFDRVFRLVDGQSSSPPVNPQEIALLYMIMAQGTLYNIEMAYNDSSAEEWLHLAERALVKGDFLATNTVPGLQTLHLMAHYHLELDKGRRGDNAWPLFGLVMRLIQAMGMHRDGTRWSLPEDVVEERRKVFWECNAADVFQAHCFSRPCAINPEHCDTVFPAEPLNLNGEKSYSRLRYELSQLSSEILNMAMKVRKPEYSAVAELDRQLCGFEQSVPFSLRCRAAFLSMPSRYPQIDAAIEASPEPSRRSMTASFQQMNLALNISETIINLHRPYYAKALYEGIDDRVKSEYAASYLTVIERCSIIIAIVTDIHSRFPAVSTRQWNIWYHVFGSALCLGTLVLRDPGNPLATLILAKIDDSICLFTSLIQHGANTPRYQRNLQWLLKLRAQASSKISSTSTANVDGSPQHSSTLDREKEGVGHAGDDSDDVELLGWRTRLIERAGQDRRTIRTISITTSPNSASDLADTSYPPLNRSLHLGDAQSQVRILEPPFPLVTPGSTDHFVTLNDFWDPLLPDDVFRDLFDGPNFFGDQAVNPEQSQQGSGTSF